MHTIYKYPIEVTDVQYIEMPEGAKILTVQVQPDVGPCLWAEVESTNKLAKRRIIVYGTGNPFLPDRDGTAVVRHYIGTFMMRQGRLVWHVYEESV